MVVSRDRSCVMLEAFAPGPNEGGCELDEEAPYAKIGTECTQRNVRYVAKNRVAGVACEDSYFIHFQTCKCKGLRPCNASRVAAKETKTIWRSERLIEQGREPFEGVDYLRLEGVAAAQRGEQRRVTVRR